MKRFEIAAIIKLPEDARQECNCGRPAIAEVTLRLDGDYVDTYACRDHLRLLDPIPLPGQLAMSMPVLVH